MKLAFFITGHTKATACAGNKCGGSLTRMVLHGAPSKEAAESWAKDYVSKLLLKGRPEQNLTKLLVLPVYEALLTAAGEEPIDWKSFPNRTITLTARNAARI